MNAPKTDELRMSGAEFDKLMRKALQATPEAAPKPKPRAKVAKAGKAAKKIATK